MLLPQGYPNKKRGYIASQGATPIAFRLCFSFCLHIGLGFFAIPPQLAGCGSPSYLFCICAFFGQDLFLPTLPAVTPLTRSYRTDSGEVLGDDMGVSDSYYCHAHSLRGECQGQLVCHSPPMYLACY